MQLGRWIAGTVVIGAAVMVGDAYGQPAAMARTVAGPAEASDVQSIGGRTKATLDISTGALLSLRDTKTGREYRVRDPGPCSAWPW